MRKTLPYIMALLLIAAMILSLGFAAGADIKSDTAFEGASFVFAPVRHPSDVGMYARTSVINQ